MSRTASQSDGSAGLINTFPPLRAARASRLESAAVVVARRGRTPPLTPPPCGGARFPTLAAPFGELLAHHAWNPPPSSSLAEEERLRSLLLRAAARDSRRSQPHLESCSRITLGIRRRRRRSQRKNASAPSSSVRRRAIPDARSPIWRAARASRLESAAVVVARRGRTPPLTPPPCGGARFPTLAARAELSESKPPNESSHRCQPAALVLFATMTLYLHRAERA